MRGWAAAILVLLSACARHPEAPLFTGEPYLLVWTGDADRQNSDFLAVLDADPTSPSYGKVLRTYPVRSRGNEDRKSTRLNSSHTVISYAVFCLKKKKSNTDHDTPNLPDLRSLPVSAVNRPSSLSHS